MDEPDRLAASRLGTTLNGKYRLERLLGVGGMAVVYQGTHRNGNRVAVKVLQPSISMNPELRDRFLREGYVANKVDHRGAVRVLDDDMAEDGSVFLVMELLEGETLEARRARTGKRLGYREVAELAIQLLDVLATAHDKGIVHRDIKPENLFLTREGVLKVLDFGIARLRDQPGAATSSATKTGHVLGTPAYMPPEQVLGRTREIDGQTDLWAVGATMFALISGHYVHAADTVAELVVYAGSRPARLLGSVAPEVPAALANVVDRALVFDKAGRWPNARAMQSALHAALEPPAQRPVATVAPAATAPMARPVVVAHSASTTGGIESERGAATRGRPQVGRRVRTALILSSAAVGIGGVVLVATVRHGGSASVAPPNAVATSPASAPASEVTPANVAVAPLPDLSAGADAGAMAERRPARGIPPARPALPPSATASGSAKGIPAVSATPTIVPVPGPNCAPPYTIDLKGRRIPKPECL